MAQTTVTSKRFSLGISDGLKAFIIAVGTPVLYILQELIPGWNLHPVLKAAIAATVTYLLKNFLDSGKIVVSNVTPQQMQSVKDGNTEVKIGGTPAPTKENQP